MFSKSLSLDTTSRIWDVYCRDGEEFLFKTAIGLLQIQYYNNYSTYVYNLFSLYIYFVYHYI